MAHLDERTIRFVGLNFLRGVVMVEYEVDPPFRKASAAFAERRLVFAVTDDTGSDDYPTRWGDFEWHWMSETRTTTRLDRRPSPEATRLHFEVWKADPRNTPEADLEINRRRRVRPLVTFDVQLPDGHGEPWPGHSVPNSA